MILLVVAFCQRCEACGSLLFGFSANKGFNQTLAEAYRVCKICGHQKVTKRSRELLQRSSVLWFAGGVDSGGGGGE